MVNRSFMPWLGGGACVLLACGAAHAGGSAASHAEARAEAGAGGHSVSIVRMGDSQVVTCASGPGAVAETRIANGQVRARTQGRAVVIVNGRVVQPSGPDARVDATCPDWLAEEAPDDE